jgi:hypothetical protein
MIPARILAVDAFPTSPNGKVDTAGLMDTLLARPADGAPSGPAHQLHESRNADDVRGQLDRLGIDVVAVVQEFVKPSARFGVVIGGALADGSANDTSPLELFVMLGDGHAMKRHKDDVAGHAVTRLPASAAGDVRLAVRIEGLQFVLEFLVPRATAVDLAAADRLRRLSRDWTCHGHQVVEHWCTLHATTV